MTVHQWQLCVTVLVKIGLWFQINYSTNTWLIYQFLKERGPQPARPPPRPQIKTCPPISRIFKRRPELSSAQSVTFLDSAKSSSLYEAPLRDSTVYDSGKKASYFEQVKKKLIWNCFNFHLGNNILAWVIEIFITLEFSLMSSCILSF